MSRKKIITITFLFFLTVLTVRPSQAIAPALPKLLDPAVLGTIVVAGGVIAGTTAHYAPAVYEAGQVACNNTGTFSRTLYEVKKFVLSSGEEYLVGRAENLALSVGSAESSVYKWISNNLSEILSIGSAFTSSIPVGGPLGTPAPSRASLQSDLPVGSVISISEYRYNALWHELASQSYQIATTWSELRYVCYSSPPPLGIPSYAQTVASTLASGQVWYFVSEGGPNCSGSHRLNYYAATGVKTTTLPETTFPPGVFDPVAFSDSIDAVPPAIIAAEVDKIITANPGAVTGAPPWSQADNDEAWRLVHSQSDDSRYSTVPPDNRHGKPACADKQGSS